MAISNKELFMWGFLHRNYFHEHNHSYVGCKKLQDSYIRNRIIIPKIITSIRVVKSALIKELLT